MAYAVDIKWLEKLHAGRSHLVMVITETDAASGSEWSTDTGAPRTITNVISGSTGRVYLDKYRDGTITHHSCQKLSGDGASVRPEYGRAAAWSTASRDHIYSTVMAAGPYISENPYRLFSYDTEVGALINPVNGVLFGRSKVDAGTNNSIRTIIVIAEGHLSASGGAGSSGGVISGPGIELTDEQAISLSLGILSDHFFTIDTRAASERLIAHKAAYVDAGATRIGGLFFNFVGPSDNISNTTSQTSFVKAAAAIGKVIPANRPKVQTAIRVRAMGIISGYNSGTIEYLLLLGATIIGRTGTFTPAVNHVWTLDFEYEYRVIGASAKIVGSGFVQSNTRQTGASPILMATVGGGAGITETDHDSTADRLPAIAVIWSVANAGNVVRMDRMRVDIFDAAQVVA